MVIRDNSSTYDNKIGEKDRQNFRIKVDRARIKMSFYKILETLEEGSDSQTDQIDF